MEFSLENAGTFLAPYLTRERKEGFLAALKDFPTLRPMYARLGEAGALQGDCWAGIPVFRFDSGERTTIKAMLISNSCDVSSENARALPVRLCFAALVNLGRYEALLRREVTDGARVESHLADVRAQKVSSLFYLPAGAAGETEEAVAVLDDIHTVPDAFMMAGSPTRVSSLSDLGFWLFLFKLSFHFCRLHENLDRSPQAPLDVAGS